MVSISGSSKSNQHGKNEVWWHFWWLTFLLSKSWFRNNLSTKTRKSEKWVKYIFILISKGPFYIILKQTRFPHILTWLDTKPIKGIPVCLRASIIHWLYIRAPWPLRFHSYHQSTLKTSHILSLTDESVRPAAPRFMLCSYQGSGFHEPPYPAVVRCSASDQTKLSQLASGTVRGTLSRSFAA